MLSLLRATSWITTGMPVMATRAMTLFHLGYGDLVTSDPFEQCGVDPRSVGKFQDLALLVQQQDPGPVQLGGIDQQPQSHLQQLLQIEHRQGGGAGLLEADELIDFLLSWRFQPMDLIKLLPQQLLVPLQFFDGIGQGPPGHRKLQQALLQEEPLLPLHVVFAVFVTFEEAFGLFQQCGAMFQLVGMPE